MDTPAAQEMPHLYRSVLDGTMELEARGRRPDAVRIRQAAIRAYGTAWDERAQRTLRRLQQRVGRLLTSEGEGRPGPHLDRLLHPVRGRPVPGRPAPDGADPSRA